MSNTNVSFLYYTDYNVSMGDHGILSITPGNLYACVSVDIINDTVFEETETFTFTISNARFATLSNLTSVNVTIIDDDTGPPIGNQS